MSQSAAIPLAQYPSMMTVRQVADYLAVSQGHVTNLIDCGSLEAINVASPGASRPSYRIARQSVATFEKGKAA